MSGKVKVILDTDIGSDIDDAVALAYLLKQPRCELLGITTVTGDVGQRAACAEVICKEAGRGEVPIHAGASEVLLHGPGQPAVPQYEAIKGRGHRKTWGKNTAIAFLRETIRAHPGEVTLLSIGPLTNVALLFAMDPEVVGLLGGFVSMAGYFFPPAPDKREWNVLVDPVASAMVYNPGRRIGGAKGAEGKHLSVGLDVTLQCKLPAEEVRRRFAAKPLNVVLEMAEVWFKQQAHITFHDPLAATLLFEPGICTYATGTVQVPLEAEGAGRSVFVEAAGGPQAVAKGVEAGRFFDHYFSVFG